MEAEGREVLNTDGEIDEEKLAEQVRLAKELNIDELSDQESAPYLKELRDQFVEHAEREMVEDEEDGDPKMPDPVGLNRDQKAVLDEVEDPAERMLIKEIMLMLAEKQQGEKLEDLLEKIKGSS